MFNLCFQFGQLFVQLLDASFFVGQLLFEQLILAACFIAFSFYLRQFQSDTHDFLLIFDQQRGGRLRCHVCLIRWYHASLPCLKRYMHILIAKTHAMIFRHECKHLHIIGGEHALAPRCWSCRNRQVISELVAPVLNGLMADSESVFHIFGGKEFIHADSLQPTPTLRNIDAMSFELRLEAVVNQAKHLRLLANWRIISVSPITKTDDLKRPKTVINVKSEVLYINSHIYRPEKSTILEFRGFLAP